jgi:type III secretion protein L
MTRIIKANTQSDVPPTQWLATRETPKTERSPTEAERLVDRLETQNRTIQALQAQVDRQLAALPQVRQEAEASGRAAERREIQEDQIEALRRLDAGIATAKEVLSERLGALDHLAVVLARTALERVFEDPAQMSDRVISAIRKQVGALETHSVLHVQVSSADFPASEDLARVASAFSSRVSVLASPEMSAGECHIKLTLGGLEVGPKQQWRELSRLFDDLEGIDP